jgi:hypothetical protein
MGLMRLAAILALAGCAAWGQDALRIVTPENTVLVGETLALQAVIQDADGNSRSPDAVAWSVNLPSIATVSATGELRALTLGIVRVIARAGSLSAEVPIQSVPRSVRITPPNATLQVGGAQQFRAEAIDAHGAVIPNVPWVWQATNRNGVNTSVIAVNSSGLLNARSDGGGLVRASFTYSDFITGFQRGWEVSAPIDVVAAPGYQISRILSNRETRPTSFELRSRPSMLWGTDHGQLFFNANLDGTANGLIGWDAGSWKMVSAGGEPRYISGSFSTEFRTHSISPGGRILAWEETSGNGSQLNFGDASGLRPYLTQNAPMAGTEGTGGIHITRNSSTSSGWVIVRASFRFPGLPLTYQGLFRGYGERITELLIWDGRAMDDFPRGFTIDYDFGITDDGVAYYSLSNGPRRIIYRHQAAPLKVIATGDPLLGSSVRTLSGGPERVPGFFLGENGDLIISVLLENDAQYFLRYSSRTGSTPESLRAANVSGVFSHHRLAGTLLSASLPDQPGKGAIVWPFDGPARMALTIGGSIPGLTPAQTVEEIEGGTLPPSGEPILLLRTSVSNMEIVRLSNPPQVIAQHGQTISVSAPLNLVNFVGGARTGPPHLLAGGSPSSIALVDGNRVRPIAAIGDRLFGTTPWFGASSSPSNWNVRKSPLGDLYFSTGLGLIRVPAGTTTQQVFLRFPLTINNVQVSTPSWVDANSRGDVFWVAPTSANDSRLFLTRNGTEHRQLLVYGNSGSTATTLDTRIAADVNSFALDDDGRVLASIRFRNDAETNIYLWSGDNWLRLARTNETRIAGQLVRGIANVHRAGGRRLFSLLTLGDGGPSIVEWKGATGELVVDSAQALPHGQPVGNIGLFETNRNGDLFFQHASGTPFLMVRRGDQYLQVANLYRLVAGDKYILRVTAVDFRDDGTVYFLAITSDDETVLFMGRPL